LAAGHREGAPDPLRPRLSGGPVAPAAAAAPWEAIHAFRLYEVAKHYIIAPFYVAYFTICANKQKFESLPKDVRDAIMSVSGAPGAVQGRTRRPQNNQRAKAGNYRSTATRLRHHTRWR
jgi:hypothetical protein